MRKPRGLRRSCLPRIRATSKPQLEQEGRAVLLPLARRRTPLASLAPPSASRRGANGPSLYPEAESGWRKPRGLRRCGGSRGVVSLASKNSSARFARSVALLGSPLATLHHTSLLRSLRSLRRGGVFVRVRMLFRTGQAAISWYRRLLLRPPASAGRRSSRGIARPSASLLFYRPPLGLRPRSDRKKPPAYTIDW